MTVIANTAMFGFLTNRNMLVVIIIALRQRGKPMNDYGTEKKQCFDDYENGTLIMSDEKCEDCEHRYECRFMQKAMDEVTYGSD